MKKYFSLILAIFIFCSFSTNAENRALLIGIGKYQKSNDSALAGKQWTTIHGDNDVPLIKNKLEAVGFTECTSLVNQAATRKNIISELTRLQTKAHLGDNIFILFSGHGQLMEDFNGDEPEDNCIIPFDALATESVKGKYSGEKHILDDELMPLIDGIKRRIGSDGTIFVAYDCCFSGGLERGGTEDEYSGEPLKYEDDEIFVDTCDSRGWKKTFIPMLTHRVDMPAKLYCGGDNLFVISACGNDSYSYEITDKKNRQKHGPVSWHLSKLIKPSPNLTMRQQMENWARGIKPKTFFRAKPVVKRTNKKGKALEI